MWIDVSTDHRIRDQFFPGVEVRHSLEYAVIVDDEARLQQTLATLGEDEEGGTPQVARFHEIAPGHAVIVAQFSTDSGPTYSVTELPGSTSEKTFGPGLDLTWVSIPFSRPMAGTFLTNTVRCGSMPSNTLDMVGTVNGPALGYARVRIVAA